MKYKSAQPLYWHGQWCQGTGPVVMISWKLKSFIMN